MPRFMRSYGGEVGQSENGFEELAYLEKAIDRRLSIFLVFFTVVVVGALGSGSSSLSAAGFSIGSIICWLLAISIILTTKKAGAVAGVLKRDENYSYAKIENRFYSKIIRWILGYIIPVFCAIVLTFGSVASSVGWLNNVWFYRSKVESKIDEIKNTLPDIKIKKAEEQKAAEEKNFTPIDSVMYVPVTKNNPEKKKVIESKQPVDNTYTGPETNTKKPEKKTVPPDKNFKPVESISK